MGSLNIPFFVLEEEMIELQNLNFWGVKLEVQFRVS